VAREASRERGKKKQEKEKLLQIFVIGILYFTNKL
jgi:hypothetical protein